MPIIFCDNDYEFVMKDINDEIITDNYSYFYSQILKTTSIFLH